MAVLFGGDSSEREISLLTGNAVLAALQRRGVDAHAFDPARAAARELSSAGLRARLDRAARPGRRGRHVQGALECLGIPYTGSGVMASALAMDKLRPSAWWWRRHCRRPTIVVLDEPGRSARARSRAGLPLIVKPARAGLERRHDQGRSAPRSLPRAYAEARAARRPRVRRAFVSGREYTVGDPAGRALPSIRIETREEFYDYQAKYFRNDTQLLTARSGLAPRPRRSWQAAALATFARAAARLGPRRLHRDAPTASSISRGQHRRPA